MRSIIALMVVSSVCILGSTAIASTRMSDAGYLQAERCLAFTRADTTADTAALTTELNEQRLRRAEPILSRVREEVRSINRQIRRATTPEAQASLAAARSEACGGVSAAAESNPRS